MHIHCIDREINVFISETDRYVSIYVYMHVCIYEYSLGWVLHNSSKPSDNLWWCGKMFSGTLISFTAHHEDDHTA